MIAAVDFDAFTACVQRLAEWTRATISAETIDAYFEMLKPFDLQDVERAAADLGTAEWFPKVGAWRTRAKEYATLRTGTADQVAHDRKEPWRHDCNECEDEGWVCATCGNVDCSPDAPAHERRMRPCPCRPTNRTYQRHNQHRGAA